MEMDKLVALCKRRGFLFQSSEIYGGLNGFWDYGPLGVELKRNVKESWWRDIVALQWDFRTLHGRERIQDFLSQNQQHGPFSSFRLQDSGPFQPKLEVVKKETGFAWISSLFHFETRIGRGSGVLRLTQEKPGEWKAYSVYTTLQELKGFEEPLGTKRPYGTIESMPGGFSGGTWAERRQRKLDFLDEEPQVLVIGAGM